MQRLHALDHRCGLESTRLYFQCSREAGLHSVQHQASLLLRLRQMALTFAWGKSTDHDKSTQRRFSSQTKPRAVARTHSGFFSRYGFFTSYIITSTIRRARRNITLRTAMSLREADGHQNDQSTGPPLCFPSTAVSAARSPATQPLHRPGESGTSSPQG